MKELKHFIREIINSHRGKVFGHSYNIVIKYALEEAKVDSIGKQTIAEIDIDITYESAKITVYKHMLDKWNNKEYEDIENIILHELCHLVTEPMYEAALDRYTSAAEIEHSREWLTERINKIIWLHKDGFEPVYKKLKVAKN